LADCDSGGALAEEVAALLISSADKFRIPTFYIKEMITLCGQFEPVAFFGHPATAAQGFPPDSAQQKRPRMRRNGSCWFFLAKHYSGVDNC
jgi:hypothetical protein